MPKKLDARGTNARRPSIIRPHSPYCEATGPIVEEGYVAGRIKALQEARGQVQTPTKPQSPQIDCRPRHHYVTQDPTPPLERRSTLKTKLRPPTAEESQNHRNEDNLYAPWTPRKVGFGAQLESDPNIKPKKDAKHRATTPEQCLPPSTRSRPVSTIVDESRSKDPPNTPPTRTASEYARCLNASQRSHTPVRPCSKPVPNETTPIGFSAAIERETQRHLESRQSRKDITDELGEMIDEALSVTGRNAGCHTESISTAPSGISKRSHPPDVLGDETPTRRPSLPRNIDLNLGGVVKALSNHRPRHNTLWPGPPSHESEDDDYVPQTLTALPHRKYIPLNRSTSAVTLFPRRSADADLFGDYRPTPSPTRGRSRTRVHHTGTSPRRRSNEVPPVAKRTISASRTAIPKLAIETIHRHADAHWPQCSQEDDWLVASPTQRSPARLRRIPVPSFSSPLPTTVQPVRHVSAPTPTEFPKKAWRWWKFVLADKTPPSESRRVSGVSQANQIFESPRSMSGQDMMKGREDELRIEDVELVPRTGDGSASNESGNRSKGEQGVAIGFGGEVGEKEGKEMRIKGKRILGVRVVMRLDGGEDLVVEARLEGGVVAMGEEARI